VFAYTGNLSVCSPTEEAAQQAELEELYQSKVLPLAEIPRTTIYRWQRTWNTHHDWRPWNTLIQGLQTRKFTDDQEAQLKETIISQYIMPGILFTEQAFEVVALQA
jgi:hypothetical protein